MLKKVIVYSALFLGVTIHTGYGQDIPPSTKTSETLVCEIESAVELQAVKASPDGKHFAFEAIKDGKRILVIDGQEKIEFNYISGDFFLSSLVFSPDSKRAAYKGHKGGKQFIFVDGEDEKQYELPNATLYPGIVFSPDSKRIAIRSNGWMSPKQTIIIDGKAGKIYDAVSYPGFTYDSKRVAYIAKEKEKLFLVVDSTEDKRSYDIVSATFSPYDDRVVYMAREGNKRFMVIDGREEPRFDEITDVIFSPDGSRMAYMGMENDKWFALIDGKRGKEYRDYWSNTIRFSPDGKHIAYIAAAAQSWKKKVLGNTEMMYPEKGSAPKKSPKWVVVVDGKEEKTFVYGTPLVSPMGWEKPKESGTVAFSPDGKRMAYVALSGDLMTAKIKSGPQVTEIAGGITKWFVIVDGKEGRPFDDIRQGSILFSPDNKHVAYVGKINDKWNVVVDGKERKAYDRIIAYAGKVVFDTSDTFHYLAREGKNIYLVEENLN